MSKGMKRRIRYTSCDRIKPLRDRQVGRSTVLSIRKLFGGEEEFLDKQGAFYEPSSLVQFSK